MKKIESWKLVIYEEVSAIINQGMSDYKAISGLADTVAKLRIEKRKFEEWANNVREFFGDEAMMEFYEIYGDEEE